MLIKSSKSEVESNNENPEERLELVEGGYLGSLGVFHELHCLVSKPLRQEISLTLLQRRLYWHMYDDRYFLNYTEADKEYERAHARMLLPAHASSYPTHICVQDTALRPYVSV
jgi:hypothetical protein